MLTKLQSFSREVVPVHLSGNVSIDPTAAIAPGVLLQANPDSILTIGAGVCIGTGSIVHAAKGNLEIGAGVCLGRGVMVIGTGSIAQNACIGSGTTVLDPQIEADAVIAPGSIVGDRSRGEVSVVETKDLPISPPPTPVVATPPVAESATGRVTRPAVLGSPNWAGDPTRQVEHLFKTVKPEPTLEQLWDTTDAWDTQPAETPPVEAPSQSQEPIETKIETTVTVEVKIEQPSVKAVAGRANFDRLKRKLFPNISTDD